MPICRMVVLHGGLPLGFRRHDRKHLKTHIAIRSKIIVVKAKQKKHIVLRLAKHMAAFSYLFLKLAQGYLNITCLNGIDVAILGTERHPSCP